MRFRLFAAALLLATSGAAQAATVYVLDSATYVNSFFAVPVPVALIRSVPARGKLLVICG